MSTFWVTGSAYTINVNANTYEEAAKKGFKKIYKGYVINEIWEVSEADSYIVSVTGQTQVRYFWIESSVDIKNLGDVHFEANIYTNPEESLGGIPIEVIKEKIGVRISEDCAEVQSLYENCEAELSKHMDANDASMIVNKIALLGLKVLNYVSFDKKRDISFDKGETNEVRRQGVELTAYIVQCTLNLKKLIKDYELI